MTVEESWASSPAVRTSMRGNRSRDTKPEMAIRRALHRMGYRYRVAARPLKEVRRSADLVFRKAKVAVFIDGCFWHGCPDHFRVPATNTEYWSAKIERNQRRDEAVNQLLADAGWAAVRAWEHEEVAVVVARIEKALGQLMRTSL